MTTSFRHESAKLYIFPTKIPKGAVGRRGLAKPVAELRPQHLPEVEFGGGWYHEAAVQEAERTRKP
jgi:hypothetical protein